MSQNQTLMARDGHSFNAYIAEPTGRARGGVVVLQEIFGLTDHVQRCADGFAAEGYLAVAPALFDRVHRNLVLGYSQDEVQRALGYRLQIDPAKSILDIAASQAFARHTGKVGVIGYCWGGLLAWIAACELHFAAAVCYYGGRIVDELPRTPLCPTMLHFGERDSHIPLTDVERLRAAYPQGIFHLYPAGHAFANDERPQMYDAAATALARARTDAFLAEHVG